MKKFATKTLVTLIVLAVIAASAYESVAVVAPNERGVQVMLGEITMAETEEHKNILRLSFMSCREL